jgi:ketosteroid isomerase-like protein
MSEHPNATGVRAAYANYAAGDLAAVLDSFAADAVFHVGGDGPMTGAHKGHGEIVAALTQSYELTGGSQVFDLHHVYADDTYGVVHVRETATRSTDGATLDIDEVHLIVFAPDGRIADFRDLPADPARHDAFFDGR